MAGGSPYPQGEEGLPGHRPLGGGVEGSGGNSKLPFHILHNRPRSPPGSPGTWTCPKRPRFSEVQEDHVDNLLPHGCKLLKQIGLEGGGPRAATCPEAMEGVVVGYGGCETAI